MSVRSKTTDLKANEFTRLGRRRENFSLKKNMASLFKVPELTEQMRSPGVGLVMRALEDADFDKGFLALLSQVSLLFRSTTTTTASVLRNMNAE